MVSQVAKLFIPVPMYDIGAGLYHIAKNDIDLDQCKKLVAGAIRTAAVAAVIIALAVVAATAPIAFPFLFSASILVLAFVDLQSCFTITSIGCLFLGIASAAAMIYTLAQGVFENIGTLVMGSLLFGGGSAAINWVIPSLERGFLAQAIQDKSDEWGAELFLKLSEKNRVKI